MDINKYISSRECTPLEKEIYSYLLDYNQDLSAISCQQIAQECKCSMASINRFFVKCGFQGYSDFKHNYYHEIEHKKKFNNNNDTHQIDETIKFLLNSKKIIIFGFGSSYLSATYLYNKLFKLDFNVYLAVDRYDLLKINHDCSIIISNSGESRYVLSIINSSLNKEQILSITMQGSTLHNYSKYGITHNMKNLLQHSEEHDEQIYLLNTCYNFVNEIKKII